MRRLVWSLVALGVVAAVIVVFALGFGHNPRAIPSPLIGQQMPSFTLTTLDDAHKKISSSDLRGKVFLINIFASWCVACTEEGHNLDWLAHQGVTIYGVDYSDTRPQARAWLVKWGNPYRQVLFDPQGTAAVDWGIWGVPETFVIDRSGKIRRKFTGIISMKMARTQVLPLVKRLEAEA